MKLRIATSTAPFGFQKLIFCVFSAYACAIFFQAWSPMNVGAQESLKIVPPLSSVAAKIHASKTPVYLPSYLPSWEYKLYGSAELGQFEYGEGYEATVATEPGTPSNSCTLFYLAAGKGPAVAPKGASQVDLGSSKIGYYFGGGNFHTLDWNIGKFAYHIACYKPQPELVKIANSMLAVK